MEDNPDSIFGSCGIDIYNRESYSIDSKKDVKDVIVEVADEYGIVREYFVDFDAGDEDEPWRHAAQCAAMVAPWLDSWTQARLALEDEPVDIYDDEAEWRLKRTGEFREYRKHSDAEKIEDSEIEHPREALIHPDYLDYVADLEYDDTIDIEERIMQDVLRRWKPEDYGFERGDIDTLDKGGAIHETARLFDERWNYIYPEKRLKVGRTRFTSMMKTLVSTVLVDRTTSAYRLRHCSGITRTTT